MIQLNTIYNENNLETMARMPNNFIDLTVTSPPYDGLRTYNGYSFDFENVAKELFRVTKEGGVIVWIAGDATMYGSETGTCFKQALFFKEIGFNLHDTMIWKKTNPIPSDPRIIRYTPSFEYMFIFSKGKPLNGTLIRIDCKLSGKIIKPNNPSQRNEDGTFRIDRIEKRKGTKVNEKKVKCNVWEYSSCQDKESKNHPASFPEKLAADHIYSWSNEGDLIYDPFIGSGTTAKMAILQKRNFIGSEISEEYFNSAKKRIQPYLNQTVLF